MAQSLSFKELQQAYNFSDKGNVPVLNQKKFKEVQALKTDSELSYTFEDKHQDRLSVTYDQGYETEGGYHVRIEYALKDRQAYDRIIASAKASGFVYSQKNKYYKDSHDDGTYVYRIIETLAQSGRYYRIRYTSHTGKELSPIPIKQ
ncbi:hypothetical protein DBR32_02970 [Taibaiella sp. KBW10]|nr:hypothetical protein DBR32_02970 [Taibaiella sp. KBW10]